MNQTFFGFIPQASELSMNFDISEFMNIIICGLHSLGQNKRHERETQYYIAFNRPT